jgi:serine/threonine protein kinase
MEEVSGRVPDIQDLDNCKLTVHKLHEAGIVHRDVNKYNFLVTDKGVKILDFENSTFIDDEESTQQSEKEIESLAGKLLDDSGMGERFPCHFTTSDIYL